jgi:hyperosmotically inducible protein
MNKSAFLLLSSLLALNVAACSDVAKTSSKAPSSTTSSPTNVDKPVTQSNQNDATSETRRKQLNSDIRANEQRNNMAGDKSVKTDNTLKSEVRSKLEANLPASALAIAAKDGAVTVTGSVVNEAQLQKIEPLAKQISGVKSVTVNATVSAAKPEPPKPGSDVPIKAQTDSKK